MIAETFTFDLPEYEPPRPPQVIIPHLHRLPPKTPWLYAYYQEHKREHYGHCNWCGEEIYSGQRKMPKRCTWHVECLNEYTLLFDWGRVRRFVAKRDGHVCKSCGLDVGSAYEVDHIRPLHQWEPRHMADLTQATFLDWYAPWLVTNLQTLCVYCHRAKTSSEATWRANNRRTQAFPLDTPGQRV